MTCIIAKVDATEEAELAKRFNVGGYPTLKFFPKGVTGQGEDYSGARSLKEMTDFMNEKCGTKRIAGGGLADDVSVAPIALT